MKVFLPYRGEFGFICMYHAPQVYAVEDEKAVFLEAGMGLEPLYPNCDYFYVSSRADKERRARPEIEFINQIKDKYTSYLKDKYGGFDWVMFDTKASRRYFRPKPRKQYDVDVGELDLVLCPRKREYGADKNWKHWQELADALNERGFRFLSAGHPDTSFHLDGVKGIWDYGVTYLDITIRAMLNARLVVATDNGLAHLAMMCGRDLALISHKKGLVADGYDDVGNPYWPIKLDRYNEENHLRAIVGIIYDAWYDIKPVVDYIEEYFGLRPSVEVKSAMVARRSQL